MKVTFFSIDDWTEVYFDDERQPKYAMHSLGTFHYIDIFTNNDVEEAEELYCDEGEYFTYNGIPDSLRDLKEIVEDLESGREFDKWTGEWL